MLVIAANIERERTHTSSSRVTIQLTSILILINQEIGNTVTYQEQNGMF